MNIWSLVIVIFIILLYENRDSIIEIFRYRKMKKLYKKANEEFILLKIQDAELSMEETLNNLDNIVESLKKLSHSTYYAIELTENLIFIAEELRKEFFQIKKDFGKIARDHESLEKILKRIEVFKIDLNKKLADGVKQLN